METQVVASRTRLRQIKLREERLISMLAELDGYVQAQTGADRAAEIAVYLNDVQVRRWVDQRRASVNAELAQTRALLAMAQSDLARHFARQQAAESLVDVQTAKAKEAAMRKGYWAS